VNVCYQTLLPYFILESFCQCDQIWRTFAIWAIFKQGHFCKLHTYLCKVFWLLSSQKKYAKSWQYTLVNVCRLGLLYGRFFQKGIRSPWGRCYDHNFLRFSPIFVAKNGAFLKNKCNYQFFAKTGNNSDEKRHFSAKIFCENFFKIPTPGHTGFR
jgi:hypothetical protein